MFADRNLLLKLHQKAVKWLKKCFLASIRNGVFFCILNVNIFITFITCRPQSTAHSH